MEIKKIKIQKFKIAGTQSVMTTGTASAGAGCLSGKKAPRPDRSTGARKATLDREGSGAGGTSNLAGWVRSTSRIAPSGTCDEMLPWFFAGARYVPGGL